MLICIYFLFYSYLLDDPLSAVDVHLGKHIFENGIKKYLKNKLVLLVTNAIEYLDKFNRIIVLNDGEIVEEGNYNELIEKNGIFHSFTKELKVNRENVNKNTELNKFIKSKDDDSDNIEIGNIEKNKLITVEKRETGRVALSVYKRYIDSVGGISVYILILVLYLIGEGVVVYNNFWLSSWSSEMEKEKPKHSTNLYLLIYILLTFFNLFMIALRSFYLRYKSLNASQVYL